MTWNVMSTDLFAHQAEIVKLSLTMAEQEVHLLAIQDIRFPSIHVSQIFTVACPFNRDSQGM